MSTEKLEQALRNWQEKLAEFEIELSITSSIEKKFELRKRIEECKEKIEEIEVALNSTSYYDINFNNQVVSIYESLGFKVKNDIRSISGGKIDTILEKKISGAGKIRLALKCQYYLSGTISIEEVDNFIKDINSIKESKNITKGLLVTNTEINQELLSAALSSGIVELLSYQNLEENLLDLENVYRRYIKEYESRDIFSAYIPLRAIEKNLSTKQEVEINDIEAELIQYIDSSKVNFISILGDFGSGKTTFYDTELTNLDIDESQLLINTLKSEISEMLIVQTDIKLSGRYTLIEKIYAVESISYFSGSNLSIQQSEFEDTFIQLMGECKFLSCQLSRGILLISDSQGLRIDFTNCHLKNLEIDIEFIERKDYISFDDCELKDCFLNIFKMSGDRYSKVKFNNCKGIVILEDPMVPEILRFFYVKTSQQKSPKDNVYSSLYKADKFLFLIRRKTWQQQTKEVRQEILNEIFSVLPTRNCDVIQYFLFLQILLLPTCPQPELYIHLLTAILLQLVLKRTFFEKLKTYLPEIAQLQFPGITGVRARS